MTNQSIVLDSAQVVNNSNQSIDATSQTILQSFIGLIDRWDILFFILALFFLLYMAYYLRSAIHPKKYESLFVTTWIILVMSYASALFVDFIGMENLKTIMFVIFLFTITTTVTYFQTRRKYADEITENQIDVYKNKVERCGKYVGRLKKSILKDGDIIKNLLVYKDSYKQLDNAHTNLQSIYTTSMHEIGVLNSRIQNYEGSIKKYEHEMSMWESSLSTVNDEFEHFVQDNIPHNYRKEIYLTDDSSNSTTKLLSNCYALKKYIEDQYKILNNKISEPSDLEALCSAEAERLTSKYLSEDYALYVFDPIFREIDAIIDRKGVTFIYNRYPHYSDRDVIKILIRVVQNLEKQNMFMLALSIIRRKT